jgi:hypothetical protein
LFSLENGLAYFFHDVPDEQGEFQKSFTTGHETAVSGGTVTVTVTKSAN